jgi:hypothetical protein
MMIAQTQRDPWQAVWQIATSDRLLIALLVATAAGLIATAWLPQTPTVDPIAYAQWLSEAQVRFGKAVPTLQTLGLFTITHSVGFRTLLALLAACLLLRSVEAGSQLRQRREMTEPATGWLRLANTRFSEAIGALRYRYRISSDPGAAPPLFQADRWPWASLFHLLAPVGALLLLAGLVVTHLWGWQVEGLILPGGERVTLPGTEEWVALDADARTTTHSAGIVTSIEAFRPGVRVTAFTDGNPILLHQTPEAGRVTQVTVALAKDQYLAIPEAQLVVRLAVPSDAPSETHSPVLAQVFRSPPGRLETEAVVEGETELTVDNVTLRLVRVPHAQVIATFNPGLWPSAVGLAVSIAGLAGSIVWPTRLFWLRENKGRVEGAGDVPVTLTTSKET